MAVRASDHDGGSVALEQIETICIVWFGLVGDTLLRVPTLERLKRTCPGAHITVLVDRGRSPLLRHHPDVDRILEMASRRRPNLVAWFRAWRIMRWLKHQRFDLMINFYGGGKSLHVMKEAQARYRLGFASPRPSIRQWIEQHHVYTHQAEHPRNCPHWGQGFTHILAPLGIEPALEAPSPRFYFRSAQQSGVVKSLVDSLSNRPFALFNIGAGHSRKIWAASRFAQLGDWLSRTHGYRVLLISNPKQEALARQAYTQMDNRSHAMILPPLSFENLAEIMTLAKFIVTGDTGPMHLAFAVECPALVIFTHTPPEYVIPDDAITEFCFKPDPDKVRDGIHFGLNDIGIEDAKVQAQRLIERLDSATAGNPRVLT